MRISRRAIPFFPRLLAAVLTLAALPLGAQDPKDTNQRQGFSERTDVVVVEVPVQVVRDGKPVKGLTAADFELYEGRKKQRITGFEVVDLSAAPADRPAEKPALSLAARRRFLMMFDLSFSAPESVVKAREAAVQILDDFHPSDLVAVSVYSPSKGPRFVLGFTSDRQQVKMALDRLEWVEGSGRTTLDPLFIVAGAGGDGGGGISDMEPPKPPRRRDRAEDVADAAGNDPYVSGPKVSVGHLAIVDRQRRENNIKSRAIVDFTRALSEFAQVLGSIQGRKHVLFLSEGFDSQVFLGTADEGEIARMDEASINGQHWAINNDTRFGNSKTGSQLETMLEELRRADCAVQAVDIGGVRAAANANDTTVGTDSLFTLANATGGELYRNFNDLAEAMETMLERTSVTYVLSYQPEVRHDGSYHKVRVELKNAGRGARVVHRPGYYAPKPYNERTPLEKMLETAGKVVGGQEGGPVAASLLAAPFQTSGGEAYVPVLLEIDGPDLLAGHAGNLLPAEVYVYAMDAKGVVRDFFTQVVGLDVAKTGPALRQSGLKFFGDLDLPPGSYSIRALARNGITGAFGLRVATVEVPAFDVAKPVLLPAFFPEPTGRWLMARETSSMNREIPYPFMAKEQPFIPASLPALRPEEKARLTLVGYNLGTGQLTAQTVVMTPDGREVGSGEIELLEREARTGNGPDRLLATFQPPKLQPGEYLLLVTVTDANGTAETSVSSFVVPAGQGTKG
ncbi:MAG TPA: VWA domain-containing protein [Thermoanaerobaculia bacterium]|nr:VWA domain-containing protein [Thermoanaerobaculia bacterium]